MGFAFELFFDPASEARLVSLWSDLEKLGAPPMATGDSRPHISLAVCDSVDVAAARALIDDFARATKPFPLTLDALGFFLSAKPIAYLAPKVTSDLLFLHVRFFKGFSRIAGGIWEVYSTERWMPHCTLATDLKPEQIAPVTSSCLAFGLPFLGTITSIGLIEFRPARQLHAASFEVREL